MKIVRKGKLPTEEYGGRCCYCGCVVLVSKEEVKTGYSGLDAQEGKYVDCPTEGCGHQIPLRLKGDKD